MHFFVKEDTKQNERQNLTRVMESEPCMSSIPTARFFCLHIDIPSEITAKYSTLTYMKNDHVKSVPFYHAYMLPVCKHMYSWFLRQRYHSSVNITKRNLECAPHCKSAPNVLTKFFSILCVQRLLRSQDYTSATVASLCLERAVCLEGYEMKERQSVIKLSLQAEFTELSIKDIASS